MQKNRTYTIKNNEDDKFKIIFDVDFISGFTIRGVYHNKFDDTVLLVEESFQELDLLTDREWVENIIIETHSKMVENRLKLIEMDGIFSNMKNYSINE